MYYYSTLFVISTCLFGFSESCFSLTTPTISTTTPITPITEPTPSQSYYDLSKMTVKLTIKVLFLKNKNNYIMIGCYNKL